MKSTKWSYFWLPTRNWRKMVKMVHQMTKRMKKMTTICIHLWIMNQNQCRVQISTNVDDHEQFCTNCLDITGRVSPWSPNWNLIMWVVTRLQLCPSTCSFFLPRDLTCSLLLLNAFHCSDINCWKNVSLSLSLSLSLVQSYVQFGRGCIPLLLFWILKPPVTLVKGKLFTQLITLWSSELNCFALA